MLLFYIGTYTYAWFSTQRVRVDDILSINHKHIPTKVNITYNLLYTEYLTQLYTMYLCKKIINKCLWLLRRHRKKDSQNL